MNLSASCWDMAERSDSYANRKRGNNGTDTHYPVESTEEENVSRLFHTLASVAMIDGAAQMADGDYEKTIYRRFFICDEYVLLQYL